MLKTCLPETSPFVSIRMLLHMWNGWFQAIPVKKINCLFCLYRYALVWTKVFFVYLKDIGTIIGVWFDIGFRAGEIWNATSPLLLTAWLNYLLMPVISFHIFLPALRGYFVICCWNDLNVYSSFLFYFFKQCILNGLSHTSFSLYVVLHIFSWNFS